MRKLKDIFGGLGSIVMSGTRGFVRLLRDTPAEVYIGVLMLGLPGAAVNHLNQTHDNNIKPIVFSELGQISRDIRDGKSQGITGGEPIEFMGPIGDYLTVENDKDMKILEPYNWTYSHIYRDPKEQLPNDLEVKMHAEKNIYNYTLPELLDRIPGLADKALASLTPQTTAAQRLSMITKHLAEVWSYYRDDFDKEEKYYEEVIDGYDTDKEGNRTPRYKTVERTRMVYDYSIHHYTYDLIQAEKARTAYFALLDLGLDLKLHERFPQPSQTNADGEYIAEKSGATETCDEKLNEEECYLWLATTWHHGSTIINNMPVITNTWNQIPNDANKWQQAMKTAESDSYRTGSQFDSGPIEYQIAQENLERAGTIVENVFEMINGINYSKATAPKLKAMIEAYLECPSDAPDKCWDQAMEIRQMAVQSYLMNFKEGQKVDKYKWYMVLLWGLGMGTIGAGIGFGIDRAAQKYGWWGEYRGPRQSASFGGGFHGHFGGGFGYPGEKRNVLLRALGRRKHLY